MPCNANIKHGVLTKIAIKLLIYVTLESEVLGSGTRGRASVRVTTPPPPVDNPTQGDIMWGTLVSAVSV